MIPLLVALTMGLVWLIGVGVTQLRVVDAARETARALARDEPSASAVALGRQVAPDGAEFAISEADGLVRVRVVAEVDGPGGLFAFLGGLDVDAEAVAGQEPS